MEQLEFFDIPSPCQGVCESNRQGVCKGCFRRREERQYWFSMTNTQKRLVLRLCQSRRRLWLKSQSLANEATPPQLQTDLLI